MKKYLAAIMTGALLLGSSPVFSGEATPRTLQEKRIQDDYRKRKNETNAYRAEYKKRQEAIKAKHDAERKRKEGMKKSSSGKK